MELVQRDQDSYTPLTLEQEAAYYEQLYREGELYMEMEQQ